MKLAVAILAGGEGRRIGGGKPLRLLGARTLLERAVTYGSGINEPLAVAVRDEDQVRGYGPRVILDEPGIEGPLGGLVAGLRFAVGEGADGLLTIPADMPFLPDDLAGRLAGAIHGQRAAVASSGGHLHPVCGLWRPSVLELVHAYLAAGRRSLKGLAEHVGYAAVDWPDEPRDPFFNINSQTDLAAAEELLRD